MVVIKLAGFTGEQPRLIPHLLPDSAAQDAIDVRLDDGGLTPFRKPQVVAEIEDATHRTIYRHGNDCLSWPGTIHAAPGPVAADRLYFTGDGAPKVRIEGEVYDLAVARPDTALTATLGGTGAGDVSTRTYVYTHVTEFGEESEPSPAAAAVDWQPGNEVVLSGFVAPPTDRAITKQRIYRTQTGRSAGTYLYLIAERDASDENFVDDVPLEGINDPLPSADWNAPPDGLTGLIAVANGMMAAFTGKKLYFCEPFRPHAWPEKYVLTMDYDIVAIAATQTSIMVVTTGTPYIVAGAHPDSMQQVKLEANLPCINARGCIDLGFAFCYPSREGLVAIRANGTVGLVSGALFNTEEWLALNPQEIVAGQISGRYVAFYDATDTAGTRSAGALFIDVGQQPFLMRSSAIAAASFYDIERSELCFLKSGSKEIYQLDPPGAARASMYWRSKEFILSRPDTFGAILIETDERLTGDEQGKSQEAYDAVVEANAARLTAGTHRAAFAAGTLNDVPFGGADVERLPDVEAGLTVGVFADGVRVASVSRTGVAVRLPAGRLSRKWEIDVSGDQKVAQIAMARTMDQLKGMA